MVWKMSKNSSGMQIENAAAGCESLNTQLTSRQAPPDGRIVGADERTGLNGVTSTVSRNSSGM